MSIDHVQLSRTMAYMLRHQPEKYGLSLDEEGWASIEEVLAALRQQHHQWCHLEESDLIILIEQSEKKRYELYNGYIRAYYGHTLVGKIQRERTEPPTILYHGTTPQAARKIEQEGLLPMKRQYVHLAADQETACQVALRRTKTPVIFEVQALLAFQEGVSFYPGNDQVWLADPVPPTFLRRIPVTVL